MKTVVFISYIFIITLIISCGQKKVNKDKTEQSEKEAVSIESVGSTRDSDTSKAISTNVFEGENGWGYEIIMNNKPYIHQPHIPGISGINGFETKEKALKVAEFVANKIKNNIMPPTVNKSELDSMGVL